MKYEQHPYSYTQEQIQAMSDKEYARFRRNFDLALTACLSFDAGATIERNLGVRPSFRQTPPPLSEEDEAQYNALVPLIYAADNSSWRSRIRSGRRP